MHLLGGKSFEKNTNNVCSRTRTFVSHHISKFPGNSETGVGQIDPALVSDFPENSETGVA